MISSRRKRPLGVDDVGQGLGRVAEHLELAVERGGALLQLVFVLEAGIEAFQVGAVPQHVRLLLHGDAARHALAHQQGLADLLEDPAPVPRAPALFGKVSDRGLHELEGGGGLPLVAGEGRRSWTRASAMTIRRSVESCLMIDRAAGRDLVVPVGRDLDDRGLLLVAGELAPDALAQAADDLVLLERRQADENGDAVAEEGDEAVLAGAEGEGGRGSTSLRSSPATSRRSPRRRARAVRRMFCIGVPVEEMVSGHGHATKIGCRR